MLDLAMRTGMGVAHIGSIEDPVNAPQRQTTVYGSQPITNPAVIITLI
jgi:hypothetical protein